MKIVLIKKKSQKTGNDYYVMRVEFSSGYIFETYVNSEQVFALKTSGVKEA